ncbi:MAG: DUF2877 domain-containing protein [Beijerinckiaceae bacterium]
MHVHALRLGPFARRFLDTHRTATVSAVFARSFHIEAGGDAMCVVEGSLGDGALNLVVETDPMSFSDVTAGERCEFDEGGLSVGASLLLDVSHATPWLPPRTAFGPDVQESLQEVVDRALVRAPDDGAFRATIDPDFMTADNFVLALAERARNFRLWLERDEPSPPPVAGLVGLGSGLTPSGDDLIGGAMIALHAADRSTLAMRIGAAVESLGADATTVLSRSMLRAAAEGVGGSVLHEMLDAIAAADAPRAIGLLDAIDGIGHTSGWDALAGAMVALRS